MSKLNEKLAVTLKNLEKLTCQLRDTKDYSRQSEIAFLLKEIVQEQILPTETITENENTYNSAHPTR